MKEITWEDFTKVEFRIGKIIKAEVFSEAKKPTYKLLIDFGKEIGVKKSSSQITNHYSTDELEGKLIIAVINFPKKQIGPIMSECLVTGFYDSSGSVILAVPDKNIELGSRLL